MKQAVKTTALGSFKLYYHTVRYLSVHQILHRLKLIALRRVERLFGTKVLAYYLRRLKAQQITCEPRLQRYASSWNSFLHRAWDMELRVENATGVLENRFTFLNETRRLAGRTLWTCEDASQLWRYQVHYFDYTVDLATAYHVTGDRRFYEKFVELVSNWLDHNPPGTPDAWHPYTLSLRTVNWLYGRCFFGALLAEDQAFRTKLDEAIALQLDYLTHHMEHDVRGNHLLKNAKALTLGSLFFVGQRSTQWRKRGLELLEHEAQEQVLPDGGHFERSLLYHLIVLQDYAETCILLRDAGQPVSSALIDCVKRMAAFSRGMLHPDGDIPLFGDAELVGPERVKMVLALAEAAVDGSYRTDSPGILNILLSGLPGDQPTPEPGPLPGTAAYPQTGYYVFRRERDYLAIDCGDPCPTYLPAHAHSDMLSYELSIGGRRFIVDAGTYEYRAGPWRQYFRSTAAHNTLIVNGMEQSRVWGSFRLAERSVVLGAGMSQHGDGIESFTGAYRAPYRGEAGFIHQRSVLWVDRSYWVVVDLIKGAPHLHGVNQILFAPSCALQVTDESVTVEQDGRLLHVVPAPGSFMAIEEGWYAPNFGLRQPTNRLTLTSSAENGSLVSAYALNPGPASSAIRLHVQGDQVLISDRTNERTWVIPPAH